jgi:hypothetical protein
MKEQTQEPRTEERIKINDLVEIVRSSENPEETGERLRTRLKDITATELIDLYKDLIIKNDLCKWAEKGQITRGYTRIRGLSAYITAAFIRQNPTPKEREEFVFYRGVVPNLYADMLDAGLNWLRKDLGDVK